MQLLVINIKKTTIHEVNSIFVSQRRFEIEGFFNLTYEIENKIANINYNNNNKL